MAAQKRRKSTGVTSFVSDVLAEQRKAREEDARLQMQAAEAWAKQDAKDAARGAREQARQDRQAAREHEIAAGHAEAEAVTRAFQARLTELETLLASTLGEDPYVSFEQLKEPLLLPEFRPPPELVEPAPLPREDDFLPAPPSGLSALAPGRKRAQAAAAAEAQAAYASALAGHAQTERRRQELLARAHTEHEQAIAREGERIQRQDAVIDRLAGDFAAGRRKAVADYFREVLARQRYPSDFPTGVKIAYLPAEQELVTDIDLPLLEAVPEMVSCEYLVTKKTLRYKTLSAPARNSLYQLIVAQMALRTVRSVFAADPG